MLLRSPVEGYALPARRLAAADLTGGFATPRVAVEVIAGAGLTTLPGVGHIPPVEAPRAMAAVIARLAGTAPAP